MLKKATLTFIFSLSFYGFCQNDSKVNYTFNDSSFKEFYERFISDSLFQMQSIKFPVNGALSTYAGDTLWSEQHWPLMTWDLRTVKHSAQDSIVFTQNPTEVFYGVYCTDCGFAFWMQFEKIENRWWLVTRQENAF